MQQPLQPMVCILLVSILSNTLHDIGKSVGNFSWLFRIFSELNIVNNQKSKIYLNHERIGLEQMKKLSIDDKVLKYYEKELLENKHFVLDKTDY